MAVFSHQGKCGDILAHLTLLAQLWQESGERHALYLKRGMPDSVLRSLLTLVVVQPYIERCGLSDVFEGMKLHSCLEDYALPPKTNLSDILHLRTGRPFYSRTAPWLFNIEPLTVAPVVIQRSARYHAGFRWERVLEAYGPDVVFVGFPDEHTAFVAEFGPVLYHAAPTYLDLARVIAGARLFCGNSSGPYWVAQGLRKPIVHEIVPPEHPAWLTHWDRPGMWYGDTVLPALADLPAEPTRPH